MNIKKIILVILLVFCMPVGITGFSIFVNNVKAGEQVRSAYYKLHPEVKEAISIYTEALIFSLKQPSNISGSPGEVRVKLAKFDSDMAAIRKKVTDVEKRYPGIQNNIQELNEAINNAQPNMPFALISILSAVFVFAFAFVLALDIHLNNKMIMANKENTS